jgi:hypothetical protein
MAADIDFAHRRVAVGQMQEVKIATFGELRIDVMAILAARVTPSVAIA